MKTRVTATQKTSWVVEERDDDGDSVTVHIVKAEDAHDAARDAAHLIVARDRYNDLQRREFDNYFPLATLAVTLDEEETGAPTIFRATAKKERGHYGVEFDVECIEEL